MKKWIKLTCLTTVILLLITAFVGCGKIKKIEDAEEALEDAGYYVESFDVEAAWGLDVDGKVEGLFALKGFPEEHKSDLDGDALYLSEECIFIIYFDKTSDAKDAYEEGFTEDFLEQWEKIEEWAEEGEIVSKNFVVERYKNVIVVGTKNAIETVK